MASNPRKALAALLPASIDVGAGCSVRPVTLGMFALLESIDSPLLEARPGVKTLELVPSLYILTHPAEESLTGGLFERAAAWADTVPVSILARIREAASRQIAAVLNVVPESKTVKKKTQTDTSHTGSSGRQGPTAGPTGK